jgi:hypothetical protein
VGSNIPEHVRYSLADCQDVYLKEYDLSIRLKNVPKIIEFEHTENENLNGNTVLINTIEQAL